jgi:hypothetical protein
MDDLNDPRISAYKPQRRLLLPRPPGYRRKLTKAQRKRRALAESREEKRITRLHLVGLTNTAVIVMGVAAAGAVVLLYVLILMGHH